MKIAIDFISFMLETRRQTIEYLESFINEKC